MPHKTLPDQQLTIINPQIPQTPADPQTRENDNNSYEYYRHRRRQYRPDKIGRHVEEHTQSGAWNPLKPREEDMVEKAKFSVPARRARRGLSVRSPAWS